MVIKNGKVTGKFQPQIQGELMPSIEENQIKCLGKWYNSSLESSVSMTEKQAEDWQRKIEHSGLPGKFKVWLFKHGLLPSLLKLKDVIGK